MSTVILDIEKKKILIPKLRFQEFREEWKNKSMRDLTKINQGLQIPISERFYEKTDDNYFYITNEFLRKDSSKSYFIKNPSESVICYEDDILMTRTGNTGQVVTGVHGAFHNNFFKIKYDETCNKWFLYFFLTSHKTQHDILKLAGTSTIPDLNHGDFYKIKINIPTFDEQQKIASFLSAVDEKTQQLSRKKELLEQYKKGVMQQLFSGKLRFKDENGEDYPNWEEKKLGEVFKIGSGKDYKHLENGTIPVFGTGGYMRSVNKYLYSGETVFIGRKGTIDKPFYFNGEFWTVDTLFYTHSFKNAIPKFIYCVFQQINWKLHNEASGVPSLSKSTIEKLKFNFPCIEEQQKIAKSLSSIDSKIKSTNQQIVQTQMFKKGLLQQMFV
ncbi:restriction endonuclease subunit S [Flavobacterium sp. ANB]|uniref:restriction endonuclease subunit S n=1 Tax=unclassified Flavobacterium TaxID=196869 RepID=UPI0012B8E48B|nr:MULTISPECIES: restriction endonuclease subunit S [unclassified Flavobacterium]MBF4515581.1 restriction endonuclease subunit S [Flavobacterium sp. ANB]MTD68584.1 restriction endonuclease subunit S [Flavobacterium sp. LC2016-13]